MIALPFIFELRIKFYSFYIIHNLYLFAFCNYPKQNTIKTPCSILNIPLYVRDIFLILALVAASLNVNFKFLFVSCATEIKSYHNWNTKKHIHNVRFLSTLLNLKTCTQQNVHVSEKCVIKLQFKFLINYSLYFFNFLFWRKKYFFPIYKYNVVSNR